DYYCCSSTTSSTFVF
nr:immunoglobulin light chain junction region [Macaca mulatta]